VAFSNFESTARDYGEGSPTLRRGTYMTTEPHLLEDIKWFGINLVSCANNHAFDYGEEGILATIQNWIDPESLTREQVEIWWRRGVRLTSIAQGKGCSHWRHGQV